VLRQVCLAFFLAAVSPATLAAGGAQTTEVEGVIRQFHRAIDRHDVAAIEALVSPDVVVLENGHRNDGWADFRDNHLIPEFKEPATPSTWEFVKVTAGSEMAWGYTKQTISATGKDGKPVGYLVWSAYVLQKAGPAWKVVLLDWSVRRLNDAN
jgi:ketosteroid isomerase-like protein